MLTSANTTTSRTPALLECKGRFIKLPGFNEYVDANLIVAVVTEPQDVLAVYLSGEAHSHVARRTVWKLSEPDRFHQIDDIAATVAAVTGRSLTSLGRGKYVKASAIARFSEKYEPRDLYQHQIQVRFTVAGGNHTINVQHDYQLFNATDRLTDRLTQDA